MTLASQPVDWKRARFYQCTHETQPTWVHPGLNTWAFPSSFSSQTNPCMFGFHKYESKKISIRSKLHFYHAHFQLILIKNAPKLPFGITSGLLLLANPNCYRTFQLPLYILSMSKKLYMTSNKLYMTSSHRPFFYSQLARQNWNGKGCHWKDKLWINKGPQCLAYSMEFQNWYIIQWFLRLRT